MKKYTSKQLRQEWLNFFKSKNHQILDSKSLIPINDPSLLWINSGVATLKDYFSGKKMPQNPRMTNSQKSLRTNDIDNVGVTARHHTFFEMLGNFSIGDYFKNEAIDFAYELLFDVFKFEKEKIYITYFEEDIDTYNKWLDSGIEKNHLIKGNREMNFWDVGMGPCGPDTEIFYDRGKKYDPENIGIKLLKDDLENDRYIEIWNIVFSQFNNDGEGNYNDLAQKNIDTGAGLERLLTIFQDAPTNFDTDLFLPIIHEVEKMSNHKYDIQNYFEKNPKQREINKKFKIIADHIRAVTVSIQDGAKPSNTQRGYIIRRLIRRAYRAGIQLGIKDKTFLHNLVDIVASVLDIFSFDKKIVKEIIKKEELSFSKTIKQGEEILKKELKLNPKELDTEIAFKLFETFGFPIELTQEIVEEKGIKLDLSKFDKLKKEHAEASKGKKSVGMDSQIYIIQKIDSKISKFIGYDFTESNSQLIFQGEENGKTYVLLDETPFYATKGGQHYDKGTINGFEVLDVFRDKYENHWHVINGKIAGTKVKAKVNSSIRTMKERNHSSTHLLGLALTEIFGKSTIQLGSDNNENRLRLDFPLDKRPTDNELKLIEDKVNQYINEDLKREYRLMGYEEAIKDGVIGLEKGNYGEGKLRTVTFGKSKEFCGGTHISNTAKIEKFKITKIDSKGSGVFRIEAVTSKKLINQIEIEEKEKINNEINRIIQKNKKLDSKYFVNLSDDLNQLKDLLIKVKKDNKKLNKNSKSNLHINTNIKFEDYHGMKAYININFENPSLIKTAAITLREKHPDSLIIIGHSKNGRTTLAVASNKFNSKELFDNIASVYNGKGGGNEKIAMGSMEEIKHF
ncbi:MAG: alanine--tRNA ligase [Mycoplasmatales bacterium]|nr:alanine--tRNA ligase [Mycoplasmatales bacterium]